MILASIDIGSNTIRLLVADTSGGRISPLRHERKVTRLATGLHKSGRISSVPLAETVRTVKDFAEIARRDGAARIIMAGTSALREAVNASDALRDIEEAAALPLDIISGQREAEIMSMGVLSGLEIKGHAVVFDIGGGSTEFIALDNGNILKSITFPSGVVRMMEQAVYDDPPSIDDVRRLDRLALDLAEGALEQLGDHLKDRALLIGTAGTATTLASLDMELERYDWKRVQGRVLSLERLYALEGLIQRMPLDLRRKIKGMDPERADLIVAGTRLTIRIMEALDYKIMTVSDHGLLEGLIVWLSLEMHKRAGK